MFAAGFAMFAAGFAHRQRRNVVNFASGQLQAELLMRRHRVDVGGAQSA